MAPGAPLPCLPVTSALVDVTVTEGVVRVLTDSHAPRTVRVPDDTPVLIPGGETSDNKEPAGKQVLLTAGQSARYDEVIRTLEAQIPDEILERKLAWRDGVLIFSGETLEEALAEIARYTDKELIITDNSIAKMRIDGKCSMTILRITSMRTWRTSSSCFDCSMMEPTVLPANLLSANWRRSSDGSKTALFSSHALFPERLTPMRYAVVTV